MSVDNKALIHRWFKEVWIEGREETNRRVARARRSSHWASLATFRLKIRFLDERRVTCCYAMLPGQFVSREPAEMAGELRRCHRFGHVRISVFRESRSEWRGLTCGSRCEIPELQLSYPGGPMLRRLNGL